MTGIFNSVKKKKKRSKTRVPKAKKTLKILSPAGWVSGERPPLTAETDHAWLSPSFVLNEYKGGILACAVKTCFIPTRRRAQREVCGEWTHTDTGRHGIIISLPLPDDGVTYLIGCELEIRETRRLVVVMFTIRFKAEAVNEGIGI